MSKETTKGQVDRRFRVLTEAEKKKIKRLYVDKMMGAAEIRRVIGIGADVLRRFLKEEGILRSREELYAIRSETKARKFTKSERKHIVKTYKSNGNMINSIAKEYGCCYTPILRVLLEEGVDARGMRPNSPMLEKLYAKFEAQDNK